MKDFKICYPDANTFKDIIKLKKIDDWNVEYHHLSDDIGYWTADHPFETDEQFYLFRDLIGMFPIQKDNNHPKNFDPNPFDTIHLPEWVYLDLCFLIRDFYKIHGTDEWQDPQIHEWGNIFLRERTRPISCWRLPHIDYVFGMVSNLWFTDHKIEDSCTRLYKYHGKIYNDVYDFQLDLEHPMRKEWEALSLEPKRLDSWMNVPEEELKRWGFELVGMAPTREKTMTLYKANICHSAWVGENVDFRWSHAFAFSHELLQHKTLKDLFS